MSIEFRPRKISEYARIALKRKWMIILPTLAIGLAIGYVVFRLPDLYESSTLIVVKPSTLPNTVVPMITEETLTRELASISQVVTSRSSLQPLIEKYSLYETNRARGESMESVVEQMRKDINVELNTTRNDITNGFNLSYRGRDPRTTQAVAAELAYPAGMYVDFTGTLYIADSGNVRIRTENGPISVDLKGKTWSGSGLSADAKNGPVTLRVPSGFQSSFVVESTNYAPVSCRASVCDSARKTWDDEHRRIEYGSAPMVLHLSTVNGPVSVEQGRE